MTLTATSKPASTLPNQHHMCYRCGLVWRDQHYTWTDGAPCIDCRVMLAREGVDLQQYKKAKTHD